MKWLERTIDRAVGYISPHSMCERIAWREMARAYYEAGEISKNPADWVPANTRAEESNKHVRHIVKAKARDRERNSDILNGPLGTRQRNIIGTGFRVEASLKDEALNSKIEGLFNEWQNKKNCDITGEQSFWELCKMALNRAYVDGSILFIKTYSGNKKFPLQLQAREIDDLDETIMTYNGNAVIDGIEVNEYQKAVAYHLKVFTPDGYYMGQSKRIEAQYVIRLWDKTRPTEIREISPLASSLRRINEIDKYMETISVKERTMASLAVFIKRAMPAMFSGTFNIKERDSPYPKLNLYPGMVKDLQAGDDISAVIPNGNAANAKEFLTINQRMFGAGQGMSHEAVSRDLSEVNYSSARHGYLEDQRTYADKQKWLIEHLLTDVYEEFVKCIVLAGSITIPGFWDNQEKYLKHRWIGPGWNWIDPIKEANANRIAIETGQECLTNICARQGYDFQEITNQRTKEKLLQIEAEAKIKAHTIEMEKKYGIQLTEKETKPNEEGKKQDKSTGKHKNGKSADGSGGRTN